MEPIILSSSSLAAFKNCRKNYQLNYVMMREPIVNNQAMSDGRDFHRHMEFAAKEGSLRGAPQDDMLPVAEGYLKHRPLPHNILMVEDPWYLDLIPGVILRITKDLVYENDHGWIVGRDYKTFSKTSDWDGQADYDYQGKLYTKGLQLIYPGRKVRFEYEHVRREAVGSPHTKEKKPWLPGECFFTTPVVTLDQELDALWEETQWVAQDILETMQNGRWYRADRKGYANSCPSCLARDMCLSDIQGGLDQQTIDLLSTPRKPLEVNAHTFVRATG